MTDTPSEYHMKRAREEFNRLGSTYDLHSVTAFAKYIAKHEPEPVDPDLELAREICGNAAVERGVLTDAILYRSGDCDDSHPIQSALAALKKGREQSAIQWIKHDGSSVCPVDDGAFCAVRFSDGRRDLDSSPQLWNWSSEIRNPITHYALINLPEVDQ